MANIRKIHVDWYGQNPPRFNGGPQLAYQGDHLSNMVIFDHAPELPNYYLLVEMKTDEAGPVVTLPEILLEGAYWVIPNYYTQICQKITYQVCCKTESEDFEHHSAKFEGTILPVIKHNGEPIDQSPMFDPYIDILDKRVSKLILDADAKEIDSELKSDSGNPVQNRVIKAKIDEIDENATALNGRLGEVKVDLKYITGAESIDISDVGYIATDGAIVDINAVVANQSYLHTVIDCTEGDIFTFVKATGGSAARVWCFIDANGNSLAVADEKPYIKSDIKTVAPANTAKIVINVIKNDDHVVFKGSAIPDKMEIVNAQIDNIDARLTDYTGNEPIDITTVGYIKADATTVTWDNVTANLNYRYIVIDCAEGDTFTIEGTGGSAPRLWCFTDAPNQNNISHVLTVADASVVEASKVITAPLRASKLLINVSINAPYSLTRNEWLVKRVENIDKSISGFVDLPTPSITNGRWLSYNNNVSVDENACYTDYVSVIPNRTVIIDGVYLSSSRAICGYDINKTFTGEIIHDLNVTTYTFTVPSNVYFIRITGRTGVAPTTKQSLPTVETMQEAYDKTHIIIPAQFRKNIVKQKIVTLIDDDGDNRTACAGLADLCDSIGMKCTFSVIAKLLENDQTHIDFWKSMQNRGFHVANHTYDHSRWYTDSGSGQMFTLAECEEDLLKAYKVFTENGFVDSFKYFVYTGSSEAREGLPELVKKWCEVGVTTAPGNNTPQTSGRFQLNRCLIDASAHDLAYYQNQLERLEVERNNWIIYYTHCKFAGAQYDATLTENVLRNAISNGYTPMTLNEAWQYRKGAYMVQEAFAY